MGRPRFPTTLDRIRARTDWRERLEREYQPTSERLQQSYTRVLRRIEPEALRLNQRIIEIYEAEGRIAVSDVRGLRAYTALQQRIEVEMDDFARLARGETDLVAGRMAGLGAESAERLALASAGRLAPEVRAAWVRPNPEALARLVGYTDSDAFRAKWAAFGENAARNFGDVYLAGIAQGKNPRVMARLVSNWYGVPYAWAENSARTTAIWSHRTANHATYAANSHIVESWIWSSARSLTTCASCWAMDGREFPVTEVLIDHHAGRCAPVPKVRGVPLERDLGPDAFERLNEADQRAILGAARYEALRRGDIGWGDMSERYSDPVFGEMLRVSSLREMGVKTA
jgi:hypothetical protein